MDNLTLDKIYHAAYVLKSVARRTDLIKAVGLCPGSDIYLKTENLQVTGSFKVRGAYYKMSQLTEEERAKGVIASSAGNHAQGVALSAKQNGIPCVICMPDGAPISKVEATKSYGAKVCLVKGAYDDAYDYACELQEKEGYTFIHPFNDPAVIAGQGTIGLEILDQMPDVDVVLVPVGGGGLISGVAFAIKKLHPECKVYGVQAAGAPSMKESLEKKEAITLGSVSTFADGIAVKHPGDLTFDLVSRYVDGVVTVTDDETACAVLALMEKQKLVTEGAGAVAVAAAMFGKVDLAGKKVLVTAGATMEAIDPVRYITNHSTGKMGYAVARAAALRGAEVTLVSAHTEVAKPRFVKVVDVTSAREMFEAVKALSGEQDIVVKAAAVADYTPVQVAQDKVKKSGNDLCIPLKRTQDILQTLGDHRREGQFLCGFSMETRDMVENSRKKLEKKHVDMIAANNLKEAGAGFAVDTNLLTLITRDGEKSLSLMSKDEAADVLLTEILRLRDLKNHPREN